MRLYFSSEFKNEIQEIGNTVTLMYLSLDDSERMIEFQSLWDNVDKVLNMSVDLSSLGEKYQDPSKVIVWYGDLSGEIIGEAFRLCADPGEVLNLCWERRDDNNTRDLNHIHVKFPSTTVSNIETIILSNDIKFLEKVSPGVEGINTFLAMEGEYEDRDYITKESYKAYSRNVKSISNTEPLYLDKNGEKVTTKTQYKHYKEVIISAANYSGNSFEGKTRYTVSNGEGIEISGQCIYDLYQVSNGEYTLIGKDLKTDITSTVLANVDLKTGEVDDSRSDSYTIEGHKITFNTGSNSDTLDFIAILNFTPEIEDEELGYVKGVPAKVKSNILEFVTYLKWNVEYPSSLVHTDGNIVLIFDYQEGSSIWSTAKEPQRSGTIKIYSESKINPLSDIHITTDNIDDQFIMSSFFDIILPEEGVYDTASRRYVYDIQIQTKQENTGNPKWYPIDDYGESKLILNTITILGSTANATSKVKFYCIQRPYYPLRIVEGSFSHNVVGEEGLKFSPSIGYRVINSIYVVDPAEGYDTWEAEYGELDSDVIIYSRLNSIVNLTTILPITPAITASTRVPSCFGESLDLGKITFHRRNSDGAYDPTYWKDLIYCHEDNSFVLNFGTEMMSTEGSNLPIYCDPDRQNYPDLKYAPTKYVYRDESSDDWRLYIFDPEIQDVKSFIATVSDRSYVTIHYSDQSLFETYFNMDISYKDSKTMLVTIRSKGRRSDDVETSWYPKSSDTPVYITIRDNYAGKNEKFYCVLKPTFSPLTLVEKTEEGYGVISELEFTDEKNQIESSGVIKHRQICYITSDSLTSEFSYWTVFSKDSEIRVFTENPSPSVTWTNSGNILSSDPSIWGNQVPYITIDTSTVPSGPDDVEFEPLVLQRTSGAYHVESLSDLYFRDWKNQLCEDTKVIIPVSMKSSIKSDSLTLLTYTKNSTSVEEIENDNIDLDYIGLYRLIVKSTGSFRVRLGATNSLDGIYFFDPSNNKHKPNVLTLDEGAFDDINGREVCFVFYGFEDKAFEVESQVLRTKIYVTNLTDGTTRVLTLTRKYFSRRSPLGILESPVIDTNIKAIGTVDKDWFIPSGGGILTKAITYKSNIETYAEFIPCDPENSGASVFISDPTGKHDIRYTSYQIQSQVKRGTKITSFCSRGYMSTEMNITCSGVGEGDKYPISPEGTIEIKNPGEMSRVTKEKISALLYSLLPPPTITTNYDTGLKQIPFPYNTGKSLILYVNAENGVYDIEYHCIGSSEYVPIKSGMILKDINGNDHFMISRDSSLDQELGEAWKIITIKTYEGAEDENLLVGGIRVKTYVPYNNFIKDALGELRNDYSQEQVNNLVRPEEKNVTLLRLSKRNSDDSIEGGNPDVLISRNGETRSFILNKVEEDSVVDCNAYESGWSNYISEIKINESTLELSVKYKDRLTRHGFNIDNPGNLRYTKKTVGGNSIYVLSDGDSDALIKMLQMSNPIISNFSIKVGENEVSSSGIYQNPWSKGISVNGYGYVGNKTSQSYTIEYTGGTVTLYVFGFDLPTTGDYTDRNNSNIKISEEELKITSTLEYTSGVFEDKVTNPTTTSAAMTSGWKYVFTVPENTGSSSETYYVYVEDTYGNRVSIPIYSNSRSSFKVRFFKKCSYNVLSEETDYVIFSAAGEQISTLYLATDDLAGSYSPTIISSYYSSSAYNSSGERIAGTLNFSNSVKSYSVESSSARVSGESSSSTRYRVYRVTLRSYPTQFSSSTGDILTNPVSSSPFYRSLDVGINTSSYKTLTCYHGSCSIQLIQPATTYLSVALDENDESETFMEYIPEFNREDNVEYGKYTTSGSFLLSNNKPTYSTSYSKIYMLNNYIYVSYSEQGSTGESKYEARFNDYGYYCGWKVLVVRKEWFEESGSLVVKNLETDKGLHPTITTSDAATIDISKEIEKVYYNFSKTPETLKVAKYELGSKATSSNNSAENPSIGVLMTHQKTEFKENGKNYTLTSPRQIVVGFDNWGEITFYISLTLDFTNN